MTADDLAAALRACAAGLYPLEAGTALLIVNGTFLRRNYFTSRFTTTGTSISDGTTPMAVIDRDAAIAALHTDELPCSGGETTRPRAVIQPRLQHPRRPARRRRRPRQRQHRNAGHRDPPRRRETTRDQQISMIIFSSEKVPEPGMWAQYDFGDGPAVNGTVTVLFCLWLAWCRFRVVLPILDKTQATVWAAVDVALRKIGGVPTYLLTDNERTVTVEHVAGIPVRNPGAVELGRHYGLTVATCVPYDPASKGGSESTVKLAKADLVPTDANLLPEYGSFAALEAACAAFCELVNARPHRVTRRAPAEMLAEERARLHPVPAVPLTAALGVTRRVDAMSLVSFEGGQYSVPYRLAGQVVHVRRHGEQVVIAHAGPGGAAEVARHRLAAPGSPRLDDAHYPPAPPGALNREPRARTGAEAGFLTIGDGAGLWLAEAAAAGASRVRSKMAQAVQLAALHGAQAVDRALGQAAASGRFADGDLAAILTHQASAAPGEPSRAGEDRTLAQGTSGWARHGGKEAGR